MDQTRKEKAKIGARLRHAREQARLSRQEAADAAHVQLAAVEAWERGSSMPTLIQFRDLLEGYGTMGIDVLFGANPFELSRDEAKSLRLAAASISPQLGTRVDVLLSVLGSACTGSRATCP